MNPLHLTVTRFENFNLRALLPSTTPALVFA
jgi:hypothetical protein